MANIHGGVQTTVTTLNLGAFLVDVVTVAAAGTPQQLTATPIPDGATAVFRAHTGNGNKRIYLANSSANALLATKRIELKSGENVTLSITNLDLVWIDASANSAKLEVLVEQ